MVDFVAMIASKMMVDITREAVELLSVVRAVMLKVGVPEEVVTEMLNEYGEIYAKHFDEMTIEQLFDYLEERRSKNAQHNNKR